MKIYIIIITIFSVATCSPTSDKLDFRWKTTELWDQCNHDQIRELTMANLDVLIASMKLQGMKYRYFHGLDVIDRFYQRFINRAERHLPVAFAVIDTYLPGNSSMRKVNMFNVGISLEEYRWLGEKMDVRRKNQLRVMAKESALTARWIKLQETILSTVLWASNYLRYKKLDTFWGSLHIQFHDLVQDEFNKLNADLDTLPSGTLKTKALHVLLEDIGMLLI